MSTAVVRVLVLLVVVYGTDYLVVLATVEFRAWPVRAIQTLPTRRVPIILWRGFQTRGLAVKAGPCIDNRRTSLHCYMLAEITTQYLPVPGRNYKSPISHLK